MRAVVCDRYGPPDVLRIAEVERPAPGPGQILIRVRATSETRTDCELRLAQPFYARFITGLRKPKWRILGYEFSGEVAETGPGVTEFAVGDEVFGANAGLTRASFGAHAEYLRMPAAGPVARKPHSVGFEPAAAACDGAILALGCLRPARVGTSTSILIYGASGSIGTAAVQLSRYFGAQVTAVCNTRNVDVVRSLGATDVIDYIAEDFRQRGESYDVIFDAVGKMPLRDCKNSIKPGGAYLATDHLSNIIRAQLTPRFSGRQVIFPIPPRYTKDDVRFLAELLQAGQYRPVIDRTYRFEDIIEAARYVETGQKTGNVVLVLNGTETPQT